MVKKSPAEVTRIIIAVLLVITAIVIASMTGGAGHLQWFA